MLTAAEAGSAGVVCVPRMRPRRPWTPSRGPERPASGCCNRPAVAGDHTDHHSQDQRRAQRLAPALKHTCHLHAGPSGALTARQLRAGAPIVNVQSTARLPHHPTGLGVGRQTWTPRLPGPLTRQSDQRCTHSPLGPPRAPCANAERITAPSEDDRQPGEHHNRKPHGTWPATHLRSDRWRHDIAKGDGRRGRHESTRGGDEWSSDATSRRDHPPENTSCDITATTSSGIICFIRLGQR